MAPLPGNLPLGSLPSGPIAAAGRENWLAGRLLDARITSCLVATKRLAPPLWLFDVRTGIPPRGQLACLEPRRGALCVHCEPSTVVALQRTCSHRLCMPCAVAPAPINQSLAAASREGSRYWGPDTSRKKCIKC